MPTAYIYNGFEDTTLWYGGIPFRLLYDEVTPIPDWTFKVVDHRASAGDGESAAEVIYKNEMVTGTYVAVELTDKPRSHEPTSKMGIRTINGERTGKTLMVHSGSLVDDPPQPCLITGEPNCGFLHVEVPEVVATDAEKEECLKAAFDYKHEVVKLYLQSKRERMSGGQGRLIPDPTTRKFMDELGVNDIDDVTAHIKEDPTKEVVDIMKKAFTSIAEETRRKPTAKRSVIPPEKMAQIQAEKEALKAARRSENDSQAG